MSRGRAELALAAASHPVGFAVLGACARRGPVVWVPRVGVVISGESAVRQVLADSEHFGKTGPGSLSELTTEAFGPGALHNIDGEAHRRMRALLAPCFATSAVDDAVCACEPALRKLTSALQQRRPIDLVPIAREIAGWATISVLGLDSDRALACELPRMSEALTRSARVRGGTLSRRAGQRGAALRARMAELSAAAPAPEGSVLARVRAASLPPDQINALVCFLVVATCETTARALPRLAARLASEDAFRDIAEGRRELGDVVDEGLASLAPLPIVTRVARSDVEVDGRSIAQGTRVLVLTGWSRVDGGAHEGLVFGHGWRRCPGASIARALACEVVRRLVESPGVRIRAGRPALGGILPAYRRLSAEPR